MWCSVVREHTPRTGGFTLLEMMVALVVLSLAALALIRLEGATIRSAQILDSRLLAQTVARNVAVEALTDAQPPLLGEARGIEQNGGRAWNWTRQAAALGDQGAVRLDVRVADAKGITQGALIVVRPANPPANLGNAGGLPAPGGAP